MNLTLHVWRQKNSHAKGKMVRYEAKDINPDMSFLEMLDVVNWNLNEMGEEPIAFDHDCREGICGSCGMMINGVAHGPQRATAACQLHMRQLIVVPLIESSRRAVTYRPAPEPRRKLTRYPSRSRMPSWQWTRRHVLGAERVSLLAPMARLPFSRALKSHI